MLRRGLAPVVALTLGHSQCESVQWFTTNPRTQKLVFNIIATTLSTSPSFPTVVKPPDVSSFPATKAADNHSREPPNAVEQHQAIFGRPLRSPARRFGAPWLQWCTISSAKLLQLVFSSSPTSPNREAQQASEIMQPFMVRSDSTPSLCAQASHGS